nr:26S proteasome IOTA SU [Cryptomonas curvata]
MRGGNSLDFDRHVTIFSREGRLLQIEYSFKASTNFSPTCVGTKGIDTVCGVIDCKNIELLNDRYELPDYFLITENIGCICSGYPSDVIMFHSYLIDEASNYFNKFKQSISIEYLTKKISEKNQARTQYAFTRPLGIKTILLGIDNDLGPKLYKLDSSGYSNSHLICAIGEKENEINNYILKKSKFYISNKLSHFMTVINTVLLLQKVLKHDIKATDLKIIICKTKQKIKILNEVEIDKYLSYLDSI